jgi:hypothetical protein
MVREMGDPPTLDENCLILRRRDEFLRGEVVGDEGGKRERGRMVREGKKERGRMAREMGWIRRRWT